MRQAGRLTVLCASKVYGVATRASGSKPGIERRNPSPAVIRGDTYCQQPSCRYVITLFKVTWYTLHKLLLIVPPGSFQSCGCRLSMRCLASPSLSSSFLDII